MCPGGREGLDRPDGRVRERPERSQLSSCPWPVCLVRSLYSLTCSVAPGVPRASQASVRSSMVPELFPVGQPRGQPLVWPVHWVSALQGPS